MHRKLALGLSALLAASAMLVTAVSAQELKKVRLVHAGFYGAATGDQHRELIKGFEREVEALLSGEW